MNDPERADEDRLLAAAAGGDEASFAALYSLLAPRVEALSTRVLQNITLAQDCTQDVFCDLWRHASDYDPAKGSARGWVMTMTHRRAIDSVRHEQSTRIRDARYGCCIAGAPAREPEDAAVDLLTTPGQRERLTGALATLSAVQRDAIERAYFDAMSHSQIAEHLGIPLGTVKTRIRDGMIQLRSSLV